jgi:hypothetical protein
VNYCVMVKRRSAFAGFTLYRSSSSFPWLFEFTLGRLQDLTTGALKRGDGSRFDSVACPPHLELDCPTCRVPRNSSLRNS